MNLEPTEDSTNINKGTNNFPSLSDSVGDQINALATLAINCFWYPEGNVQSTLGYHPNAHHFEHTSRLSQACYGISNIVLALLGIIPAVLGHVLTAIANTLKSHQFTHLCSQAHPAEVIKTFLHLNACMFPGGLPYFFGNMPPARERIDSLVTFILKQDAEMIALSEINRTISHTLFTRLRNSYKNFYIDIGLKSFGMEAGLFIASKVPITSASFISFKVPNQGEQKMSQRGFFLFETKEHYFIYTHLAAKGEQVRVGQVSEIKEIIKNLNKDQKSVILFGDLNINKLTPNTQDYEALKELDFYDHGDSSPTCGEEESIDYVLSNKPSTVTTELLQVPFSDHRALKAKVG